MAVRSGDTPSFRGRARNLTIPHHHATPNHFIKKRRALPISWIRMRKKVSSSSKYVVATWISLVLGFVWMGTRASSQKVYISAWRASPRTLILRNTCETLDSFAGEAVWNPTKQVPGIDKPKKLPSDERYERYRLVLEDEETGCPFIDDYQSQTTAKPTCNALHELGIKFGDSGLSDRLEPINSGGYKDVWRILNEDDTPRDFVLKTSLYEREFRARDYDRQRVDTIIMEEATASPFVMDMYAYCGQAGLVEEAKGTLGQWVRRYRKKADPIELLEVAAMVAQGVADMHLYHNGMPTVIHADIKASQFLIVGSGSTAHFKINDFNRGGFLTSKNPPEICPIYISGTHVGSTSRAPEEYVEDAPLNDKIDVFSTGAVFYYILTGEPPFDDYEEYEDAINKIVSGVEPPLPREILESTDPSINAIVSVMKQCMKFHAEDRPNSKEVASQIARAFNKIKGNAK